MVSALSVEVNRSPAVTAPTTQRMSSATTSPALRPDAAAQQREHRVVLAGRLLRRGLDARGARRWRGSGRARSCDSSFHDEVQDPGLVELGGAVPRGRPRPRGRRGPGRRDRAPPRPRWRRRRRRRRSRRAGGSAGRSRCGRRRRRRGWARRAAAPGSRAAASGRARPSAGCRPTGCATARVTPAGRTSRRLGQLASDRAARRPGRGSRPRENGASEETVMLLVDRLVEQQPLALALLRRQPDAGLDRRRRPSRGAAACRRR